MPAPSVFWAEPSLCPPQAFYYPEEAGLAFGGPGSSRFLRLEVHYHNPLVITGRVVRDALPFLLASDLPSGARGLAVSQGGSRAGRTQPASSPPSPACLSPDPLWPVALSASSLPPHNDHGSGRVHSATFSDYILGQMATLTCAGNINHAGSEGTGWLQPHLRWVLKLLTLRSHNSPPESQRSFWAPGQVKPPDHLWALARGRG